MGVTMARGTDNSLVAALGAGLLAALTACSAPVTEPPAQTGGGTVASTSAPASPATETTPATTPGPSSTPGSPTGTTTGAPSAPPPAAPPSAVAVPTGCPVPSALAGRDVESIGTDRKVIALTFDGGANADGVDRILAVIDREKVPVTFFVTGDFATKFPEQTRKLAARGAVGNHTQTHPDLTTVSAATTNSELDKASAAISSVTGKSTVPYFRFPFGARNPATIRLVNDKCFVPFRWTTDTLGWKGTSGGMSVDKVRDRVLDDLEPGGIVLMHLGSHEDGSALDADALPAIIAGARERGYSFVGLDAAFAS